jgi:uncharacterized membrane protein
VVALVKARIESIDTMRGAVMLLMTVDHVRFFFSDARFNPTDAALTTVGLFVTRWITHFCAPVFLLLAGIGARLSLGRGRSVRSSSKFLLTRGLWLIFLELTVARFGWQFNFDYAYAGALVFWAIGWSMVVLAALVWLPARASLAMGVSMIVLHDLTDDVHPTTLGWLWSILHAPSSLRFGAHELEILYPLVPWIGVMATGYGLADFVFVPGGERRLRLLGAGSATAFVVLRAINGYGDPSPWRVQSVPWRTVLSFLDTTKYPPSLCFLLMTLGPALLVLPSLEGLSGRAARAVRTFGRVPLFFWLLHVPLIHLLALAFSVARYGRVVPWLVENPGVARPDGYGYGLATIYLVTALVIAALYPLCARFAELKARRRDEWLSYL